ncbi:MAG: DnaA/Hda family protein [Parachlamydiaceae bacterium]
MKAWEDFVKTQEQELGGSTVQKWLKTLKVQRFDAGNLYLEAGDAFQAMWFEEHMRHKVITGFVNNNNRKIKVHVAVENALPLARKTVGKSKKQIETPLPSYTLVLDALDPACTFDRFVVSQPNLLTHQIFTQVVEMKDSLQVVKTANSSKNCNSRDSANLLSSTTASIFNPIYVHGTTGSGKTHLLMATAAALRAQGKRVAFARAQTFADHVVSAIRSGEMSAFRQAYRNNDVLIIDDVHVLSRKGATQEEFFHTFNTLQMADKQIILSANSPPKELQLIEPRLVSRFEWGIVLSLERPSKEDTEKILAIKIKAHDFPLHKKVVDFLLGSFETLTALNKALEALILRAHMKPNLQKCPSSQLTVLQVKQELTDLLEEEQQAAVTPKRIIGDVAEFYGIKPEDISGNAQTRDCVLPRQISMYLCRTQLKLPFLKIGAFFSRDHSTVMSSVKLIQKAIDTDDSEIASAYRAVLRKLTTTPV